MVKEVQNIFISLYKVLLNMEEEYNKKQDVESNILNRI